MEYRSSNKSKQDEKEDDLVLAAKLGQTLLEQNEELSSENNSLLKKIEVKMIKLLDHTMDFYLNHLRLYSKKLCSTKRTPGYGRLQQSLH